MYLLSHPLHVYVRLLEAVWRWRPMVLSNPGTLRGSLARSLRNVRAGRPSVSRCVKWPAISTPLRGPDGLYQVPIQLIAPDMAKEASLASQGAMDLSAIPSSM